jgi:hypothetical protein
VGLRWAKRVKGLLLNPMPKSKIILGEEAVK